MNNTLNRNLWLLTGRQNDFVNADLNTGVLFPPQYPDEEVTAARKILHLGVESTDYYVIGAMASLFVFRPELTADVSTMFLAYGLEIIPPSITGGLFGSIDNDPPCFVAEVNALPAPTVWEVNYKTDNLLEVVTDTGSTTSIKCRLVGGTIYPEWENGFKFSITPTNGIWNVGSKVFVTTSPGSYPYGYVAGKIKDSNMMINLMLREGTLAEFHAASSDIHKVGALAAAVMTRMSKQHHV